MRMFTRISRAGWAVAVTLALGLSACDSSTSGLTSHAKKKAMHVQQGNDPADRSPQDMVAAVSPSKAGPPVELKFELRESPEAGQPLDVDIAILPDAPAINRVYAKFQGGEGLELVDGGDLEAVEKPAQGTVIRHVVRLIPKEEGIFTVSATVAVDLADDSVTRTFAIPVIVGSGLADLTAKTEAVDAKSGTARALKPN